MHSRLHELPRRPGRVPVAGNVGGLHAREQLAVGTENVSRCHQSSLRLEHERSIRNKACGMQGGADVSVEGVPASSQFDSARTD